MTIVERQLSIAGAILFFFGLGLGFALPAFADREALLNAHVTALGSGTFLIVMGAVWPKLEFSQKTSRFFAHLLWISFYVLQAGLTLAATTVRVAAGASPNTTQTVAGALNAIGAVFMAIAVMAIVVALLRVKSRDT